MHFNIIWVCIQYQFHISMVSVENNFDIYIYMYMTYRFIFILANHCQLQRKLQGQNSIPSYQVQISTDNSQYTVQYLFHKSMNPQEDQEFTCLYYSFFLYWFKNIFHSPNIYFSTPIIHVLRLIL